VIAKPGAKQSSTACRTAAAATKGAAMPTDEDGQYDQKKSDLIELELELIQSHMAQKPVLRGEVGCAYLNKYILIIHTV